ncbi:cobalamin/Fe3+-siderophore ABC transporter ATP-binding protein [Desulfosarcina ovata subsp. sediminis]|uniref:Cobalamin/Fe3+-siderophore ABC transporter ATP-binding protein n=1 Tax=Desulfosarcina ovata subsp. sediminis TaxID=885957 RepID=A0A5K7ZN61_9BACT|nr:ABC transporter ATP-binding protein [Desulfosarcina ovata]BBO82591.1 cobalamin/Fe3+-siderophore ABC transporter ATP-binding protein [Desulfosarcina ovata subsp. sediminis]
MNDKTTQPILSCRNLTVGYKEKAVLSGLNLDFTAGQFISLLGPNGAGKTTLLRTLSRHLDPLAGQIEIEGRLLSGMRAMELAAVMAVVLTDKVSPPLFTVYEFVALGRYPHTDFLGRLGAADHQAVRHAIAAVHADDLAARTFNDLSDGERQKALVARALAQQPRLLLLDEPTLHLDLKHRVEVMGILRNLCRSEGITVVASLHDVDVAAKVSDRVALIKSGAVVDWGIPETVLKSDAVAGLYDFDGADFDHHLGSIELRGNGKRGRAFVLAGMGSGALIYRMLSKRGFSIATGVLHTNDLDYYVARSLGAACISQEAMQAIGEPALAEADARLDGCDVVIDCGFQVGSMNQGNVNLLHTALEKGKPVLSLRKNGGDGRLPSLADGRMVRCDDVAQLLEALDQCGPGMAGGQNPQPEILQAV